MKFYIQLQTPISGNRTGTRTALLRTVLEIEFPTAQQAIDYLALPWTVTATIGRAIAHDPRPVNSGGGVTVLATRQNGKPIRKN
jgi:hypothetical protein